LISSGCARRRASWSGWRKRLRTPSAIAPIVVSKPAIKRPMAWDISSVSSRWPPSWSTRMCALRTISSTGASAAMLANLATAASAPNSLSEPQGLTLGPDGALHVALEIGEVARLEPW
jgi:hypothetical protein